MSLFFSLARSAVTLLNFFRLRKHATAHRRCPKEDCSWAEARDGKEKKRHVWYHHRSWAQSTGYPPMDAKCDKCSAVFAREDGVNRHNKEVHRAIKRVRKSGG